MNEYPDDFVKSTFVPNRPSTEFGAPEESLPFEDEAVSMLVKLGVQNWGRASLAIASVYLRNAFNDGRLASTFTRPLPNPTKNTGKQTMPEGKSEIPVITTIAEFEALPKDIQDASDRLSAIYGLGERAYAIAAALMAERGKTLGYIDHFIESVEVEVEGRTRFSIQDINRECKKSMRYVRDQITGDFEQNWLPRPSTEENLQHD